MRLCFQFVLHRHGTRLLVPAAGLSAGRAVFLRSPARADTGIAATAAGTLLGMATMLAGSSSPPTRKTNEPTQSTDWGKCRRLDEGQIETQFIKRL